MGPSIAMADPQPAVTSPPGVPRESSRPRVLFVPGDGNYREEILVGVAEVARDRQWNLHSNMRFTRVLPSLEGAAGILVSCASDRIWEWLADITNLPVVHAEFPVTSSVPKVLAGARHAVEPDYREAGRLIARHLLELGMPRFYFWNIPWGTEPEFEGFKEVLAAHGKAVTHLAHEASRGGFLFGSRSRDERVDWLARYLQTVETPAGFMFSDDVGAVEMMEACCRCRLRVPEDIAIVGCDNRQVEQALAPVPLSTVDMNYRRIGRQSAILLDDLINGRRRSPEVHFVPPAGLIIRQSSATYICDSPAISAAMIHLRRHFREPLRIGQLAKLAGLSLRAFQIEFKRHTGRTALEVLQSVRIAEVERLLRETDLKLDAIAVECGFSSGQYLSDAFLAIHRVRPSVWREAVK